MTAILLLAALIGAPDELAECRAILKRFEKQPYEQRRRVSAVRRLGKLATPDSTRVLEGLLDDPFAHLRDEAVSALIALKRRSAAERAPSLELLTGWLQRRGRPETRRHLATALGLIGDRAAIPGLIAALKRERDPDALAAIAQALARLRDDRAVEPLQEKALRFAPGRAACVRALAGFGGSGEWVIGLARDPDDAVVAAVVDVLVARHRPVLPDLEVGATTGEATGIALADALPATRDAARARRRAAALLAHPSWRVRAAAIAGVERLRDPTLLPELVERLEQEPGRLRADAWNALRALTGKQIPPDPAQWRALLPLARLPERTRTGRAFPPGRTRAYFGLPFFSNRIAFVFDVSGSMRDDKKIERARERFRAAATALSPEQRCDLFVYRYLLEYPPRPRLERCFGKLVAGKARRAADWLDRQPARGAGAIYDALAAAMLDAEVDTIYLLSDGVPSFGTVARDFRILQEVERLNRWRRVVIHTILLGHKGTDRAFMRRLAEASGGVAVDGQGSPLR